MALTPIILILEAPNFFIPHIPRKLKKAPDALYIKVDIVPPKSVTRMSLTITNTPASLVERVYKAIKVMILANPSFAPGANKNGDGMARSNKLIITA